MATSWAQDLISSEQFDYRLSYSPMERVLGCGARVFPFDCYVTLHLPSASCEKFRTRTVRDSRKPVWNETFYFRIQTQIKNILQLEVHGDHLFSKNDVQVVVDFDLAKVQPGATVLEIFSLKPEKENSLNPEFLEVEFKLSAIAGPPEHLISNGVLVAQELSVLEVIVGKEVNEQLLKAKKTIILTVQESYEGTQKTTKDVDSFLFHCIKSWEPVLKVKFQSISHEEGTDSAYPLVLPLKQFPLGQEVKVRLPREEGGALELYLRVIDWSQNLDVRLGYELCAAEQDFLHKRKQVVADAFNKLFNLRRYLPEDEVPVVAVMATGGGLRAMTALYGNLLALQKLNILDCVSYITSASGSTWTLTNLYQDANWSQKNLEEHIQAVKPQILKSKWDYISVERLKVYHKELVERAEMGYLPSFTALWALVLEAFLHDKPNESKLSEQRSAINQGQNPLPIYTAMNVKDKDFSTFDFREWMEFNPYEVGFLKYGAYISAEDFDSKFFMGKLMKRLPESRICYLEGIWSNIFSLNLLDGLYWCSTPDEFWERWVKDMSESERKYSEDGGTTVYKPPDTATGKLCEIFNDILTDRPLKGATHNFLRSLAMYKDYMQQSNFIQWNDTVFDESPSKLTPSAESLCLTDICYFINNSGSSLLNPKRNVDVIIMLDYGVIPFKQTEMFADYCEVQGIPFPKVELSEEDRKNPKECYVFSDDSDPRAPIVVLFPLVDSSFKEYTAPGVKRTPSEMSGGEVNLHPIYSPYQTLHVTYSEENFDKLLNLSTYNILCSKDKILHALQYALQKRQNIWTRG
ncbi:cytosolic phospholipase A2 beta-like [Tiliqua scincoides]|uniref:cytosolic phospholipase A2 beta-like n=1 Tax=Tiliqua scincoides TaxID=71010 RepID=UPI0034619902